MRIPTRSRCSRGGYTLLEVMLASVIAILVLIALYIFMEVSLRQATEGRDVVERATVARGVIKRIESDLAPSITPPSAKPKQKSSTSSNQSQGQGGQNTANANTNANASANAATTPMTGTGMDTTGGMGTTTDPNATTEEPETPAATISLQAGVIGYADTLTIYTTRVPDARTAAGGEELDMAAPSDIRRIVYWIGESGGLCRQEIPWFTAEGVHNAEGPILDGEEKNYLIAPEVVAMGFEYYDISAATDDTGWTTEWDGRLPGPDGLTPKGPPTAIRVSFTIKYKNQRGEDTTKDYRHVIPILTASGPNSTEQLQSPDATDTPSTTTSTNQGTTTPTGQ